MLKSLIKKQKAEKGAGISDLNASGKHQKDYIHTKCGTLGTQKKTTHTYVKGTTIISSFLCLGAQLCLEGNKAEQIPKCVGTI